MKISKGAKLIVLGLILIVIDQIIKVLVKTNMDLGQQIYLIGEWCRLCFIENEGMAFGMSLGTGVGKLLLTIFRIILSGLLIFWISRLLRREPPIPTGVLVGLTLITAGALGNLIDCLFYGIIWDYAPLGYGHVVDMFYFPIIRDGSRVIFFSPVFNFADSCVTIGAFYLVLFQWKFFSSDDKKTDDSASTASSQAPAKASSEQLSSKTSKKAASEAKRAKK